MILVTGSTGFIGSQICRALVKQGLPVRALHRSTSSLAALQNIDGGVTEYAIGDVTKPETLHAAFKGVEVVFHAAAVTGDVDAATMQDVTVLGTRNVLQAAAEAGVRRVVHTSSVVALGVPKLPPQGKPLCINEFHTWNLPPDRWRYGYSKYQAELEVQLAVARGLDVVIANPAVILGAGDVNKVNGNVVIQIARRRVPFAITGGLNIVHVEDVVRGHLLAMERGRRGERYILGGENLTIISFISMVARLAGVRPPLAVLPARPVRALAGVLPLLPERLRPPIGPDLVRTAGSYFYYDTSKAREELGMGEPRPALQAVTDAYRYYREVGEI